jgi:hypothetical protein
MAIHKKMQARGDVRGGELLKTWQKALVITLVSVAIGGVYLLFVWHQRSAPGVVKNAGPEKSSNMDDYVVMRAMMPRYFEHMKRFEGLTVWVRNGYIMPYYPYEGGKVIFAKPVGVLAAAQKLELKKAVKQAAPANVDDGISHGSKQALLLFTLPGETKEYALAVGAIDGSEEAYFCDQIFFYDDPHTIYDHWSKDVWAAIDAHQVKPGMSERQSWMAIGQKFEATGYEHGNRTVHFDQAGKKWTITYVNDKATEIKNE